MKKTLDDGRVMWFKTLCWAGIAETVPCINHSYAYSGKMPCTGDRLCIHCGKPEDEKEG